MKKKWFRTMDLVDEKYILEADPGERVIPLNKKPITLGVLASCACLALLLGGLWRLLPQPGVEGPQVAGSYDAVIRQLSLLQKNDAYDEFIVDDDQNMGAVVPGATGSADSVTSELENSTYQEVTNNQVEGITEADRIKRSDTHIYYLDGDTLRIFTIAGAESCEVGHFKIHDTVHVGYLNQWAFYLSEDCRTATVIATYQNAENKLCVGVVSVDVSDPAEPAEKHRVELTGNYISSRVTGGKLLLMTEFVINKEQMDFEQESSFLPQINGESIAPEKIYLPEEANSARYTVLMQLEEDTLAIDGEAAFLSYSRNVYVSREHIFLTHVFSDVKQTEEGTVRNAMTQITCVDYTDGFRKEGSAVVRGYVKDQWSMDEYQGILRVVTTTNATTVREDYAGGSAFADALVTATGNTNASLYCIDLQSFAVVASVEDFAPPREEVQSVRFEGTTVYVCTSLKMSDPVFFFDLADLEHITYKDTGTIDGFSTSLVEFGDGYLLGIGQESWGAFKAEIYRETATGVEPFCKYVLNSASYSVEYRSYYIDRENRLLGLGVFSWGHKENTSRYILLQFDGYHLIELLNVELEGDNACKRGVYIDGFMYLFGKNAFKVEKVL